MRLVRICEKRVHVAFGVHAREPFAVLKAVSVDDVGLGVTYEDVEVVEVADDDSAGVDGSDGFVQVKEYFDDACRVHGEAELFFAEGSERVCTWNQAHGVASYLIAAFACGEIDWGDDSCGETFWKGRKLCLMFFDSSFGVCLLSGVSVEVGMACGFEDLGRFA